MRSVALEPFYEFSAKGLRNPQSFRKHADHAVREIFEVSGGESDIQIHVEPEVKSKGLFTLSISTDVDGKPVTVKRTGRRVYTLLRQAKKTVVKLLRRSFIKRIKSKRQPFFVDNHFFPGEAS